MNRARCIDRKARLDQLDPKCLQKVDICTCFALYCRVSGSGGEFKVEAKPAVHTVTLRLSLSSFVSPPSYIGKMTSSLWAAQRLAS